MEDEANLRRGGRGREDEEKEEDEEKDDEVEKWRRWVSCIVGGSISRSSRSGSDRGSSGTRGSSRTTSRRSLGSGRDVISGVSCGGSS